MRETNALILTNAHKSLDPTANVAFLRFALILLEVSAAGVRLEVLEIHFLDVLLNMYAMRIPVVPVMPFARMENVFVPHLILVKVVNVSFNH